MKKILVTGSTGLIGSHLIEQLTSIEHYEVYAIARRAPVNEKVNWIEKDLSVEWNTNDLPEEIDIVVHLAQSEHFRDFPKQVHNVFSVNTLSTLRLIDYAVNHGASNFVYASSAGIYGSGSDSGFVEEQEIVFRNDLGFYLSTKYCSEIILENYWDILNVTMLRFFFVYGKNQNRTMLLPRLYDRIVNSEPIDLQGEDGIKISLTHVSDAVKTVVSAFDQTESHKFNVTGPEILSLRQIGHLIGEHLGKEARFNVDSRAVAKNITGDHSKMSKYLHQPQVYFKKGVNDLKP